MQWGKVDVVCLAATMLSRDGIVVIKFTKSRKAAAPLVLYVTERAPQQAKREVRVVEPSPGLDHEPRVFQRGQDAGLGAVVARAVRLLP